MGVLARFVEADGQRVFFMKVPTGQTGIVVILFGTSFFAVPVDTTGGPAPEHAWRLDWHRARCKATTCDEMMRRAIIRVTIGWVLVASGDFGSAFRPTP